VRDGIAARLTYCQLVILLGVQEAIWSNRESEVEVTEEDMSRWTGESERQCRREADYLSTEVGLLPRHRRGKHYCYSFDGSRLRHLPKREPRRVEKKGEQKAKETGTPCPVDLAGADLRKANLEGADLRQANLRDANLRGADLTGADVTGAVGITLQAQQSFTDSKPVTDAYRKPMSGIVSESQPGPTSPILLWEKVKAALKVLLTGTAFTNWIERTKGESLVAGVLTVAVEDEASAEWIKIEYQTAILAEAASLGVEGVEYRVPSAGARAPTLAALPIAPDPFRDRLRRACRNVPQALEERTVKDVRAGLVTPDEVFFEVLESPRVQRKMDSIGFLFHVIEDARKVHLGRHNLGHLVERRG
jgi:hypothetical protein